MKVLFVCSDLFFSEPLGVMALSAMCKKHGHETRLAVLSHNRFVQTLDEFDPDLVAYSVMTSHEYMFREADVVVRKWALDRGKKLPRIMGGAHPTYFPEVLNELALDAICLGDGDFAMIEILKALENGDEVMADVPNVATPKHPDFQKQVIDFMDGLPHADRDILYDEDPDLLKVGIRSFLTQKGCPYKCTYCFNHAFNKMFKGEGRKLLRRRSVDDVIAEVKHVADNYPVARVIRFSDDVFVIREDAWLDEFSERFPVEVGLPFYCLIRANALTEPVAKKLKHAGCVSASMSIEAGSERLRNTILKRNMPDEMMIKSFGLARKYGINIYGNTILGIPGTTLDDDFESYLFSKKLKAAAPTFGIFNPYPGTELTDYAIEIGDLDPGYDFDALKYASKSVLKRYTDEEREQQVRLMSLAMIFCKLPNFMDPVLKFLIRLPLTRLYGLMGSVFASYTLSTKCFPGAYPRNPKDIVIQTVRALKFFMLPDKDTQTKVGKREKPKGVQTPTMGVSSPDYSL